MIIRIAQAFDQIANEIEHLQKTIAEADDLYKKLGSLISDSRERLQRIEALRNG